MFRSCWCLPNTVENEARTPVIKPPESSPAKVDKTKPVLNSATEKISEKEKVHPAAQKEISANASCNSMCSEPGPPFKSVFSEQDTTGTPKSSRTGKKKRTATLQELTNKYKRGVYDPEDPAAWLKAKRSNKPLSSIPSPKTPSQEGDVPRRHSVAPSESAQTSSDSVDGREDRNIFSTRSTLSNCTSGRPQPISELQNLLGMPEMGLQTSQSDKAAALGSHERTPSGLLRSINEETASSIGQLRVSRENSIRSVNSDLRSKLYSNSKSHKLDSQSSDVSRSSRKHRGRGQEELKSRKSVSETVRQSILRQPSFGTPISITSPTIQPCQPSKMSFECLDLESHPYYQPLGSLSGGSQADVLVCLDQRTNEKVIVKMLSRGVNNAKAAEREIANLRLCAMHPYIIHMREVFLTSSHLAIAMDFAEGGNLCQYIDMYQSSKTGRGISEDRTRSIFYQIVVALDFCHRMGFANRDIKLDNVLLVPNGEDRAAIPTVKLSDFGFSKDEYVDSKCKTACGTPECVAPEVLTGGLYDGKFSDIWSLGVLFYAMLTGNYPFSRQADKELDANSAMRKLFGRIMGAKYAMPQHISREAQDLLQLMLKVQPEERLDAASLLKHPFFKAHSKKAKLKSVNNSLLEVPDEMLTGFFQQTDEQVAEILRQASRVNGPGGSNAAQMYK